MTAARCSAQEKVPVCSQVTYIRNTWSTQRLRGAETDS